MREILFYENDFGDKPVEEFLTMLDPAPRAKVVRTLERVAGAAVCPVKVLAEDARDEKHLGSADGIRGKHLPNSGLHVQGQPRDSVARFPKEIPENATSGIRNC